MDLTPGPREDQERIEEAGRPSEAFRRQVREARRESGLTQEELAERVKSLGRSLHATAVTRIENGERGVSLDDALVLAEALGISLPGGAQTAVQRVTSAALMAAYRAGREEAARDIEAAAPEPLINISGRSSKPTADEAVWFARLMAYGHAASIARGGSDG